MYHRKVSRKNKTRSTTYMIVKVKAAWLVHSALPKNRSGIPSSLLADRFCWLIDLDTLERYLRTVTEEDLREIAGNEGYGGQVQAQGRFTYTIVLSKCSSIQTRSLSPRFGMSSSSRCTANISSQSTTFRSSSTIRSTMVPADDVASEHLRSSWLNPMTNTRLNFSSPAVKPSAEFPSLLRA
jgi:hypothetical protein